MNPICLVAGKSGGHIIPCITLAKQYKERNPETSILFITTDAALDQKIIQSSDVIDIHLQLPLGSLRYTKWYQYPFLAWQLLRSFLSSIRFLYRHKPVKIISSGSLVAVPVCLGAWLLGIPIELYELNVEPGKAVKMIAPFATKIFVCFKQTKKYLPKNKCQLTAYPVRFTQHDKKITQQEARNYLKLQSNKKTLFILGGSQGSQCINNLVKQWFEQHQNIHQYLQCIHQVGSEDVAPWQTLYQQHHIPAFVFPYYQDLAYCYQAADIILCRAGAGTLAEVSFFNKPCITIPLETRHNNHQVINAYAVAEKQENVTVIRQQKNKALLATLNQIISV